MSDHDETPVVPGEAALQRRLHELIEAFARSRTRLYFYAADNNSLQPLTPTSASFAARLAQGAPSSSFVWWQKLCHAIGARHFDWIFDVGVNYGYTTAWFAKHAAHVIAIEPSPVNQALIREQIAIRNLVNVELVAAAAGAAPGRGRLHLKSFDGHHSLADIGASATIGVIDVPVVTLDALAFDRGIDRIGLLKIDVEGFEMDVLEGAASLLAARRIERVAFEFSPAFYRQRGLATTGPIELLARHGYALRDFDGSPVDAALVAQRAPQSDLLAFAPGIGFGP
jgi:FkbM family methyltransferase